HRATSTISTRRQRFVRDSGRHSTTRTVSPTPALFVSSCARSFTERRMIFLYFGWAIITSTRTVIVLSPEAETTSPRRSLRWPCSVEAAGVRVYVPRSFLGAAFFFGAAFFAAGFLAGARFGFASAAGAASAGAASGSAAASA